MDLFSGLQAIFGESGTKSRRTSKSESPVRKPAQESVAEPKNGGLDIELMKQNIQLQEELEAARYRISELEQENQKIAQLEQELANIKKERAQEEKEMASKRDDVDQLICGVTVQIQEMIQNLDQQMEQLEFKTDRQIRELSEQSSSQIAELKGTTDQIAEVKATAEEATEKVAIVKEAVDVTTEQISSVKETVENTADQVSSVKETVDHSATQLEEMKELMAALECQIDAAGNMGEQLDKVKKDLMDAIHSENVQCFRNMKGIVAGLEEKMKEVEITESSMQRIQKSYIGVKVFSFFGVLSFIAVLFHILYSMGIIAF